MSAPAPLLPTFLIVGAAKAGTTALYRYLGQHPEIFFPSSLKETFYFSGLTPDHFTGPGRTYARQAVTSWDAYTALFREAATYPARGEACVAYLYFYEGTLPRLLERLGSNIRIIISLRNPVERAYSNYLHHVRDGIEPLAFEEALQAEERRRQDGWWWGFRYLDAGRYAASVEAYLRTFGSDRLFFLRYDDFFDDATEVLQSIFRFLGVDDGFEPDVSHRPNISGIPRSRTLHTVLTEPSPFVSRLSVHLPTRVRRRLGAVLRRANLAYPPISLTLRKRLQELFREDVTRVQDLTHLDLSAWLLDS